MCVLLPFARADYRTGEAVSKQMYFEEGDRMKVEWRAKPARGNCVITLMSLFNSDLLFDTSVPESQRPRWSEIAIETFGGRSGKLFQTQYITQEDENASPTERGKQHVTNHVNGGDIPDIFDGKFHTFGIEFKADGGELLHQVLRRRKADSTRGRR